MLSAHLRFARSEKRNISKLGSFTVDLRQRKYLDVQVSRLYLNRRGSGTDIRIDYATDHM